VRDQVNLELFCSFLKLTLYKASAIRYFFKQLILNEGLCAEYEVILTYSFRILMDAFVAVRWGRLPEAPQAESFKIESKK
jgi:hypothetical protein